MRGVKDLAGVKAIGFDVDGTLYQSKKELQDWIYRKWVGEVATLLGVSFEVAQGLYEERYAKLKSNTETLNSFGLDGRAIAQQLFDELPVEKYLNVDEKLVEMMEELRKQYRLFVISNGSSRQVLRKMETLGLRASDFDPLICCYDQPGWNKPSPTAFWYAVEQLGFLPEEVVFVGDRVETDIEPAQKVGMRTVFVGERKSEIADFCCETIYQVGELFLTKRSKNDEQ